MRRLLALVAVLFLPLAFAQDPGATPTFAHPVGTFDNVGGVDAHTYVMFYSNDGAYYEYYADYRPDLSGGYPYFIGSRYQTCAQTTYTYQSHNLGSPAQRDTQLKNMWQAFRNAYISHACDWEIPAEPPPDLGDGWTVWDDMVECPGGMFGHRPTFHEDETVTYDVSWSTSCGGSYFGGGLTGAERESQMDAFEAACTEVCDDPRDDYLTEPVPSDPPEPQECTGVDGLACESTLRDIRELLARQVEAEQPAAPLPFPDQPGEEQTYAPPYDASSPDFEAWTAPDIAETSVSDLVDLIETRAAAVVTAAEGRLPFGLMSWVPDASLEGTATCDNPTWTILRTTEEIGWCDSAPETWLATTGRALSLILATFAFGFAVVRTVAWA